MSMISQIIPLVVLFAVIGGLGFVGYQVYLGINRIQEQASKKNTGNRTFTFSKDGMRVNVKDVKNENYVDATQKVLVDVWQRNANTAQTSAGKKAK